MYMYLIRIIQKLIINNCENLNYNGNLVYEYCFASRNFTSTQGREITCQDRRLL